MREFFPLTAWKKDAVEKKKSFDLHLEPDSDSLGLWNLQVRVILGGAVVVRFAGWKGR